VSEGGVPAGTAVLIVTGVLLAALALHRVGRRSASPPRSGRGSARASTLPHIVAQASQPRRAAVSISPTVAIRHEMVVPQSSPRPIEVATRPILPTEQTRRAIVIQPTPESAIPTKRTIVLRPISRPYWDLTHWREVGDRLVGFYRTPWGSFEGYILHARGKRPQFYLVNPPPELSRHPHRGCFHDTGQNTNTYLVHLWPVPENADAGILAIEKVLGEALREYGRSNA